MMTMNGLPLVESLPTQKKEALKPTNAKKCNFTLVELANAKLSCLKGKRNAITSDAASQVITSCFKYLILSPSSLFKEYCKVLKDNHFPHVECEGPPKGCGGGSQCSANAECIDDSESTDEDHLYKCSCNRGFQGDGRLCERGTCLCQSLKLNFASNLWLEHMFTLLEVMMSEDGPPCL